MSADSEMQARMQKAMGEFLDLINKSELDMEALKKATDEKLPEITPQNLSGKVAIVTGANVGIGYETSKSIASMNPEKIIMACRSVSKGEAAKAEIQKATGFKNIEVWELDLASFASVKAFTKRFNSTGLPLHILVSNAGVAAGSWVDSEDGYEISQQINHLSNVLLVLELTPALAKAPGARVNIVSSDVHYWAQAPQPEDPHPVKNTLQKPAELPALTGMYLYPISKLYNVLFAQEYSRRFPQVFICSSNPGPTFTELGSKDPATGATVGHAGGGLPGLSRRETYEGAKTIIYASIDPTANVKGGYYTEMRSKAPRSFTLGDSGAKFGGRVWKDTIEVIKPHLTVTDAWIFN